MKDGTNLARAVVGWLVGWAVGAFVALSWVRATDLDGSIASLSVIMTSVFAGSFVAAGVLECDKRKK